MLLTWLCRGDRPGKMTPLRSPVPLSTPRCVSSHLAAVRDGRRVGDYNAQKAARARGRRTIGRGAAQISEHWRFDDGTGAS
jgi:hypothetical protein